MNWWQFRWVQCWKNETTLATPPGGRQLSRIEEQAAATKQEGVDLGVNHVVVAGSSVVDMATQQGQILTWREAKLKNQVVTPPPLEERLSKVNFNYQSPNYSLLTVNSLVKVRLEEKSVRNVKKRHHQVNTFLTTILQSVNEFINIIYNIYL